MPVAGVLLAVAGPGDFVLAELRPVQPTQGRGEVRGVLADGGKGIAVPTDAQRWAQSLWTVGRQIDIAYAEDECEIEAILDCLIEEDMGGEA